MKTRCRTGSENSLRIITEKEIIKAWEIGLSLQSKGSTQKQEQSDGDNGSAECSTITIETRREGTDMRIRIQYLDITGLMATASKYRAGDILLTTAFESPILIREAMFPRRSPRRGGSF